MHGGQCENCGLDTCGNRCRFYPSNRRQQLEDLGVQPITRKNQVRLEDNPEQRPTVSSSFDEDANSIGSDGIHFNGVGYSGDDSEEATEDYDGDWDQEMQEAGADSEESPDELPEELIEWLKGH